MADEIGGYFARLRLIVDQDDFNTGIRTLTAMEYEIKQTADKTSTAKNNWSEFTQGLASAIYIIKQAASALKELYGAYIPLTAKTVGVAAEWGVPSTTVQTVQNIAKVGGVSPDALTSGLTSLIEKMSLVSQGKLDESQVLGMHFIGLDWTKERNKSAPDLLRDIIRAAQSQPLTPALYTNVEGLLGSAGKELLQNLQGRNIGIDEAYKRAASLGFTTQGSNIGGLSWFTASNELKTATDSLKQYGMGELGAAISPAIEELVNFLISHKDELKASISIFMKGLKDLGTVLIDVTEGLLKILSYTSGKKIGSAALSEQMQIENSIQLAGLQSIGSTLSPSSSPIAADLAFPLNAGNLKKLYSSGQIDMDKLSTYAVDKLISQNINTISGPKQQWEAISKLLKSGKDPIFNLYFSGFKSETEARAAVGSLMEKAKEKYIDFAGS